MQNIDNKISVSLKQLKIFAVIDLDLSLERLNLQQNTNQLKIIDINYEIKRES